MRMEYHCGKCGRNLLNGTCWRCNVARCGACGRELKKVLFKTYARIGDSAGGLLPYRTDRECHEHSTQWTCLRGCFGWKEVVIFDDGQRFRFTGKWEPC
jgi:bacterioferritin-associated ferredoxin